MSEASPESRASLLTPPGRGAVAVIAAEGPAAVAVVDGHFRAANRLPLSEQRIDRINFGHWVDSDAAGEEVIVCRTGAFEIEVHCHGGVAAADRILAEFASRGCCIEPWSHWLRAHSASRLHAEADEALAAALTRRTAAILLDQRHGALEREIEAIAGALQAGGATNVESARERLATLCARIPLGQHLTQPWQIAIAGRPNVGKSSLINTLVGYERAIVFNQPGTTRDVLAADTAINGWPVRLTDSAGLRATSDPLEAAGVELTHQRLEQADVVLWVLDAATLAPHDLAAPLEAARREMAVELATPLHHEAVVVLNKSDLISALPCSPAIATCALTGAGLPTLLAAIADRVIPHSPPAKAAVPFVERHATHLRTALELVDASDLTRAVIALRDIAS